MYKKGYFFRAAAPSSSYTTSTPECCIQIPSTKDREQMQGMPAGLSETQDQRLSNMVRQLEKIKAEHASLPVMTTDQVNLPAAWEKLFVAISQGDETAALAMLIKYRAQTSVTPLKFIIVGTDVNRDNGLSQDLMESASALDICHVDVFDSLVYPGQDQRFISREFKSPGTDVGQKIKCWNRGQMNYFAVDLSLTPRGSGAAHVALLFALQKIEEQIASAQKNAQKVWLVLPTGWDSHQDETAACGKCIHGRTMSKAEAQQMRFSNEDLTYFYERIFALYHEHKESIAGIYWGLEGGYNRPMYEQQIQLLMSMVLTHLLPQYVNSHELSGPF